MNPSCTKWIGKYTSESDFKVIADIESNDAWFKFENKGKPEMKIDIESGVKIVYSRKIRENGNTFYHIEQNSRTIDTLTMTFDVIRAV